MPHKSPRRKSPKSPRRSKTKKTWRDYSKSSQYRMVKTGKIARTSGGLTAADIVKKTDKHGKVRYVSKKKSGRSKGNPALKAWTGALARARKELGFDGSVMPKKTGGTSSQKKLYALAKQHYHGSSRGSPASRTRSGRRYSPR